MKIRNDYVSNSSSSSFVVETNASDAAKMFISDFGEFLKDAWNDPLGETMHIGYKLKSKKSDWFDYSSPNVFCFAVEMKDKDDNEDEEQEKIDLDDIEEIQFECDDYDNAAMMYLRFLYKYFEKLGFKPDDSNSEQDFRKEGDSCLLGKLLDRINGDSK